MIDDRTFVIVGAGLAGAKAAETLRSEGFSGRVVLLGEETERPYERPPLSKGMLLGTAERGSVYVHAADWYRRHDVDLRTSTPVRALDRTAREVRLADDSTIGYDRLLLATGAEPRRLPLPGDVCYLRTLEESHRLAARLHDGARLVIIGAGWIGLEVAAAARERGAAVTVIETAPLPLHRVLGDRLAASFAALHAAHGVVFHFGRQAAEFRADGVLLDDGTLCPADTVLVAVGVRPRTELARAAGLAVGDGILVDHRLCTDDPSIFAAGDVAAVDHALLASRVRVEHWANAIDTGAAAARAMLGQEVAYDRVPYFFTDQYDLGMEYSGLGGPGDTVVTRGDPAGGEFIAFWLHDGRVTAGMNVNVWDVTEPIQELIRSRRQVPVASLTDADTPLERLTA